jgi:hypothetical protein
VIHGDPVNLQVNQFYLKFRKILSLEFASETASALESIGYLWIIRLSFASRQENETPT